MKERGVYAAISSHNADGVEFFQYFTVSRALLCENRFGHHHLKLRPFRTFFSRAQASIAIAKIDLQIEAFSKAGQRPARTQPEAERERCLGLRTTINTIAPSGREKPRFVPLSGNLFWHSL